MLLYAITDRLRLAPELKGQAEKLSELAAAWAKRGVDYIQIREKDLSPADLTRLATSIVQAVRQAGAATKVLINSSLENVPIIRDCGADGIHLPGSVTGLQIHQTRQLFPNSQPVISVSCHSVTEIRTAREAGATLALFAPVFEKPIAGSPSLPGHGIAALAEACRAARQSSSYRAMPVLALGGITPENAQQCLAAGAAGIAGVRLFLAAGWPQLRSMTGAPPDSPR